MRIALLNDTTAFAGTERHLLDLATGLAECGVDVSIVCPPVSPLAERALAQGCKLVPWAQPRLIDPGALQKLRSLLRQGAFDILHAHNGRTTLSAVLAVALAGKGRCVMTQHFLAPDHTTRSGLRARMFHAAHHRVDRRICHFVAISQAVREQMLARGQGSQCRTTVVLNGISEPNIVALAPFQQVRQDLGVAPDVPLILCAARLEPEKDIATLVAAMQQVAASHPRAVCVIAGQGVLRPKLEQQIKALGLETRCRLLGFRKDVMAIMNAADVFVLPSLAEPFGLVLLEAMAMGKPIVATRAGGPPEIVDEGQTGLLVAPSNPEELAEVLSRLLADPPAAAAMGRLGRQRYEQHFTSRRMAQQMVAVYEQVMRGPLE